jgi:hypothetical protein
MGKLEPLVDLTERQPVCERCDRPIGGLILKWEAFGTPTQKIVGEDYDAEQGAAEAFVRRLDYEPDPDDPDRRVAQLVYHHSRCDPDVGAAQTVTVDDIIGAAPAWPASLLHEAVESILQRLSIPPEGMHAFDQNWQTAVDEYRRHAGLDLHSPTVLDAALMTLLFERGGGVRGKRPPARSCFARDDPRVRRPSPPHQLKPPVAHCRGGMVG